MTPQDPMPDPTSIDVAVDELVTAVLTASRVLVGLSARSLASVQEALTLPQFRVLVLLEAQGPMNISQMGEHLDVTASTATRMVERLASLGLLDRETNTDNRREILIRPSPTGSWIVQQVVDRRRREIADVIASMPTGRRHQFVEALSAFGDAGQAASTDAMLSRACDQVDW